MTSSLTFSELMSLMDSDADEHNSDADLIESPTHVFPHNLPDYVDVDPTTVVTNLQDETLFHPYLFQNSSNHSNSTYVNPTDDFNDTLDSQSRNIPHSSPADDVPDDVLGDIPWLSPSRSIAEEYPVQKEIIKGKFSCYISNTKDVDGKFLYSVFQYRYGVNHSARSVLRSQVLDLITECVDVLRGDTYALNVFVNQLKEIRTNILDKGHPAAESMEAHDFVVEQLIGQSIDVEIFISNHDGIRNKGCGKHRRIIGPAESQIQKPPKAPRLCRTCMKYVTDHDSRNYKKKNKVQTVDVDQVNTGNTMDSTA
ncbi:hypothetical protein L1987_77868 [Smallanthus sonchifolius]|uniref:Uncharacterized protein n=1 Tax=Smallanthus sonchifolius TaxID=185202 RepID=A0ACB8ZC36_9ASTR|nr:hypothetical protein L1987_77868 [Smallanthus sonchifolius]